LYELRRHVAKADAKETAGELSELLRRIAMARYGRSTCAGLSGEEWLDWLQNKDPTGFDWRTKGLPLLDLPYAPPGQTATATLRPLIDAALVWLAAGKR
jgi:hypothetical protein